MYICLYVHVCGGACVHVCDCVSMHTRVCVFVRVLVCVICSSVFVERTPILIDLLW